MKFVNRIILAVALTAPVVPALAGPATPVPLPCPFTGSGFCDQRPDGTWDCSHCGKAVVQHIKLEDQLK